MRIISGEARGRKLFAPAGEETRPTSDKVRGSLFNIIGARVYDAEVLDLFGGTGAMALEALSRGAEHAVIVDSAREAIQVIERNAQGVLKDELTSRARILRADYRTAINSLVGMKFDLVFLDPPYAKGLLPATLAMLADYGLLSIGARVVCESADEADVFGGDETLAARYEKLRATRYGAAFVTILTPKEDAI
jgi:16S rRNA (guanine(966)-N(2))-methyltransferase RsmD